MDTRFIDNIVGNVNGHFLSNNRVHHYHMDDGRDKDDKERRDAEALDRLPRFGSISSPGTYFPGSRDGAMNKIITWADDPSSPSFLWLHSGAGVGKSMIAHRR